MKDLEKIACARSDIQKLANGINPMSGQEGSEGDVVNHVRISRCLFYVPDILGQIPRERRFANQ